VQYHGNWCGPGWSGGKYQSSVDDPDTPATDEFDQTCKDHDAEYARGGNLKEADDSFYTKNYGKGLKRTAAALAVRYLNSHTGTKDSWAQPQIALPQRPPRTPRVRPIPKGIQSPKGAVKSSGNFFVEDNRHRIKIVEDEPGLHKTMAPNKAKSNKVNKELKAAAADLKAAAKGGGGRKPRGRNRPNRNRRRRGQPGGPKSVPLKFDYENPKVKTSGFQQKYLTIKGTERLGNINVTNSTTEGEILMNFLLSPNSFPTTRLRTIANMYEKYIFVRCRARYVPKCATSVGGGLIGFWDYDPLDTVHTGPDGITQAVSAYGATEWYPYIARNWQMRPPKKQQTLYTDTSTSDPRLTQQARLIVMSNSTWSSGNLTIGTVYLDYQVQFLVPHIQETILYGLSMWEGNMGNPAAADPLSLATLLHQDAISVTKDAASLFTVAQGGTSFYVVWEQQASTACNGVLSSTISGATLHNFSLSNSTTADILTMWITSAHNNWSMDFNGTTAGNGITHNHLTIIKLPYSLATPEENNSLPTLERRLLALENKARLLLKDEQTDDDEDLETPPAYEKPTKTLEKQKPKTRGAM
jgi:hypothetical protein